MATPEVTFTYDGGNRMTVMTDGTGTTTFGYVPLDILTGGGQPATEVGPLASGAVSYGYDTRRRRTSRSVNSAGILGLNFDVAGRASTVSAGALGSTSVGYVPNTGRISTLTHGSGQLTQFAYLGTTGDHRLSQISHTKPAGGGALSTFYYGYDAAGQITAWTQWATTGQTQTQAAYALVYDAADRLKDAVAMSGGVATKAFHYTYDNADNRLTEQAGTTSRGFNAFSGSLNQLNSQTAGGPLRVSGAVSAVSTVTVNGQNATPLGAATVFSTDLANPPPGNLGLTVVATTAGAGSNSATATYHVKRRLVRRAKLQLTMGTLTCALAHPREIFKIAILASAAAIVVSHSHPSGDPAPSGPDLQITRQLREAAKIIGIDLIDHVIVGTVEDDPLKVGHYSFKKAGLV